MTLEEYKEVRVAGKNLASKILDKTSISGEEIGAAAQHLGFWNGSAIVTEDSHEQDMLMDFLIYERFSKKKPIIERFYDSTIELNDLEEEVLEAMMDARPGLYELQLVDKEHFELTLNDVMNPGSTSYKLMDIALTHTNKPNILMYTRLLPIRGVNMTSGVSFGFSHDMKDKVLADINFAGIRKRRKLRQSELYIFMKKLYKSYGLRVVNMETTNYT